MRKIDVNQFDVRQINVIGQIGQIGQINKKKCPNCGRYVHTNPCYITVDGFLKLNPNIIYSIQK